MLSWPLSLVVDNSLGVGAGRRDGNDDDDGDHDRHHFQSLEFTFKGSPCIFHHASGDLVTYVHGDDYVTAGDPIQLKWLRTKLEEKYECHGARTQRAQGIESAQPSHQVGRGWSRI